MSLCACASVLPTIQVANVTESQGAADIGAIAIIFVITELSILAVLDICFMSCHIVRVTNSRLSKRLL